MAQLNYDVDQKDEFYLYLEGCKLLGKALLLKQKLMCGLIMISYYILCACEFRLWNNYRHIPSYGAATSMATLLEHVQMYFPHITNIVLSRVMKFSFPDCNKFVNKQGAYYQSLVRRPDVSWGWGYGAYGTVAC